MTYKQLIEKLVIEKNRVLEDGKRSMEFDPSDPYKASANIVHNNICNNYAQAFDYVIELLLETIKTENSANPLGNEEFNANECITKGAIYTLLKESRCGDFLPYGISHFGDISERDIKDLIPVGSAEVKKSEGHWIKPKCSEAGYYKCSKCGEEIYFIYEDTSCRYCPHCGAKLNWLSKNSKKKDNTNE